MAVSFCGVDLVIEDPGGRFHQWLDTWQSLSDTRLWGEHPITEVDTRRNARHDMQAAVGLPCINWPAPPRLKVNALWWPTGATRWACGLFLASQNQLADISINLGSEGQGTLTWTAASPSTPAAEVTLSTLMYLVSPKKVTAADTGVDGWLLPLVDQRYWWQFFDTFEDFEADGTTTWADLFGKLRAALGVPLEWETVSSDYGIPDPWELTRRHENAASILDAVAWSVGQRVVVNLDGSVKCQGYSAAREVHATNIAGAEGESWWGIAGGGSLSRAASAVKVVFPKYQGGEPQTDGDTYYLSPSAGAQVAGYTHPSATKVIFSTAHADFTNDPSLPHNYGQLNYLAQRIAQDYFGWCETNASGHAQHDYTYVGLRGWQLTGYDDYVWWHYGHQVLRPDNRPGYIACTRVAALPPDVGVSEQLQQFWAACTATDLYEITGGPGYDSTMDEYWYYGRPVRYVLESGKYIRDDDATDEAIVHPTSLRKSVSYEGVGPPTYRIGMRVYTTVKCDRREIISPPLTLWRFAMEETLTPGGYALAKLLLWSDTSSAYYIPTATIPPGTAFYAFDVLSRFNKPDLGDDAYNTKYGYAQYCPDSNRMEILQLEQPARWIRFSLSTTLATSDESAMATIDFAADGYTVDPTGLNGVRVYNLLTHTVGTYVFEGDSGDKGMAVYRPEDNRYYIVQMECP